MNDNIHRRAFLASAGAGMLAQDKPVGIAAIGVGNRGFFLMKEFQNLADVEIRVICDLYDGNLARAKEFSKNTRARYTEAGEEAIAAPGVDAVVIATPDFWHAPMALAAAKAKKDIYLEKPL